MSDKNYHGVQDNRQIAGATLKGRSVKKNTLKTCTEQNAQQQGSRSTLSRCDKNQCTVIIIISARLPLSAPVEKHSGKPEKV